MAKPRIVAKRFAFEEIQRMVSACSHPVETTVESFEFILGGLSTTTVLVTLSDSSRVVLKIFYPNPAPLDVFQNAMNICSHIAESVPGIPICKPLSADGRIRVVQLPSGEFPCVLMNYISNSVPGTDAPAIYTGNILREFGSVLARIHSIDPLLSRHKLRSFQLGGAVELWQHCGGDFIETVESKGYAEFANFYKDSLSRIPNLTKFHQGIIHGDPFLENILVDQTNFSLTGLVDFEDACVGPVLFDLASAISGSCFDSSFQLNYDLLESLLSGYTSIRPLPREERTAVFSFIHTALLCNCAFRFIMYFGNTDGSSNAYLDLYEKMKFLQNNEPQVKDRIADILR